MTWEALGAIGEIVGAVAVVLTLGFLVFQIRQNTMALRQQSARESTSALQQVSIALMDPAIAGSVCKPYVEEDPDLTTPELVQLEHFMLAYLLVFQQDYLDWRRGLQPSALWESRIPIIDAVFVSQWSRKWWHTNGRVFFTPAFQKVIEQMLSVQPRDDGDYWRQLTDASRITKNTDQVTEGTAHESAEAERP